MVQQQFMTKIKSSTRSFISFSDVSETNIRRLLSEIMPMRRIDSLISIAKESPTGMSTDILTAVTLELTPNDNFNIIINPR